MNQVSSKGIVLSRTDYGEADRIVTFLTPDHGKVRIMAKGVRKPKSKLAGGIELFSVSSITFVAGRGDLHTLVSSRLEYHYGNIVKDIARTMYAYDVLKLLSRVLEDEAGEDYYQLLEQTLAILNNLAAPKDLAEASFSLQLMGLLGHLPPFTGDARGNKLDADSTISYQFSFDDMAFFAAPSGPFSVNHIKLLRLLSHNPPAALLQVQALGRYLGELTPLIRQMLRSYVVPF